MEQLRVMWDILSIISTLFFWAAILVAGIFTLLGFVPVLIRLGNGLWRRKIVVFASGNTLTSLSSLLLDSKLFYAKNVLQVSSIDDIEIADRASVFLVYWPDWKDDIQSILDRKSEQTALVVYAPQSQGFIPPDVMNNLESRKHTVVNNFRGRLLNDLVTSMITTAYEKR